MKKWFIHILLLAGLFGMLTTSCSQDEEIANIPSAGTPSEKVTIRFTLDLGEQGGMSSRATWGEYDEDGTGDSSAAEEAIIANENLIDTGSLQVFMFDTEGTYIGGLKDMEAERQGTSNIYNIQGEVDVVKDAIVNETLNCKIMVVANADAATTNSNKVIGYNNDATFTHDVTSIPMWGIGTYEIDLIQQLIVELNEPIYMLRSMAKIEVTLKQEVYNEGYRITGATLNKYNTQGYVVPAFKTNSTTSVDLKNLSKTTVLSTADVFREKTSLAGTASISLNQSVAGKTYVIYVPEMTNSNTSETDTNGSIWIDLRLAKINSTETTDDDDITESVSEGSPRIYLKDYNLNDGNDGLYSLTRNHWYKYTVNSIDYNTGLDLTLAVAPWTVNEDVLDYTQNTVNYNVTTSTLTNPLGWIAETFTSNEDNIITLDLNKTATFKVQINTPINAEWKVSLDDPNDMFEFNTNNGEGFSGTNQEGKNIHGFNDNDGEVVTIGIKSKSPTTSGTYSAILRMYINMGTKWVQIDLVDGDISDGVSVYTIKHVKASV